MRLPGARILCPYSTTRTATSQYARLAHKPVEQPFMPGDHSKSEPPLPIPNRTVKRLRADDSADYPCESRSSPGSPLKTPQIPKIWGVLLCGGGKRARPAAVQVTESAYPSGCRGAPGRFAGPYRVRGHRFRCPRRWFAAGRRSPFPPTIEQAVFRAT